jgi:methionyl-tRNA formyltransferase
MSNAHQCGVTLQTLDEESFDNGTILAQTPPKGLAIPFRDKCTYRDLLNYITPLASAMLVQGLRDRVFVPPLIDVGWLKNIKISNQTERAKLTKIVHAPKITSMDKRINWKDHSAITIERRYRALGRLWSEVQLDPETKKRIVFEDIELVPIPEVILQLLKSEQGTRTGKLSVGEKRGIVRFMVICPDSKDGDMKPRFFVVDGDSIIIASKNGALRVKKITVEGKGKQDASKIFKELKEWDQWKILRENFRVIVRKQEESSAPTLKIENGAGDGIHTESKMEVGDVAVKAAGEEAGKVLDEEHHNGVDQGVKK